MARDIGYPLQSPIDATDKLVARAGSDRDFRQRLLAHPKETIETEFGVTLDADHEIHVHEESCTATHVVLPPLDRYSRAEREEARAGAGSLEFLRRTLHDPAPPARVAAPETARRRRAAASPGALAGECRESIRRGLTFLESTIDERGAWHCIRFNIADPAIPRHFERPPFISALCALALETCADERARSIRSATRRYLVSSMEYPGLWRYYRHLPADLDSTSLCSLALSRHPWIALGRNVPHMLANRDGDGLFQTWLLAEGEPDVASDFRIEADPVVNANVIACLGCHPATREARHWLENKVVEDRLENASKWYPDTISAYYAIGRAMVRAAPALEGLRPVLVERILALCDGEGGCGNLLQTSQAITALHTIGALEGVDVARQVERFVDAQRDDGSWPEYLAFGDQSLRWGVIGQIGHGSESVTSAFCIEALGHMINILEGR
ncbi:MAG: hypothetical protein OXU19_19020 [bacterium]|nr:hypothetical protein [bacterium]MDE0242282.1 hypothetical protein [bacterium]